LKQVNREKGELERNKTAAPTKTVLPDVHLGSLKTSDVQEKTQLLKEQMEASREHVTKARRY
jgi:hypothetical protein